jgi:heme-degrading monooxygenase HmoA
MITRITRGRLRPNAEARVFEMLRSAVQSGSAPRGMLSLSISRRAAEDYVELVSVTIWEDVDAMAAALGPAWREPTWMEGLEDAVLSSDLEIYETAVFGYDALAKLARAEDA